MDRSAAIDRLPDAYAAALRLQDEGFDEAGIAATLGLAPASVGPLLRVAAAKLQSILAAAQAAQARPWSFADPRGGPDAI